MALGNIHNFKVQSTIEQFKMVRLHIFGGVIHAISTYKVSVPLVVALHHSMHKHL